jgi:NAD+ synthase
MTGLALADVKTVCDSIDAKRKATAYLHQPPLLVEDVPEIAKFR